MFKNDNLLPNFELCHFPTDQKYSREKTKPCHVSFIAIVAHSHIQLIETQYVPWSHIGSTSQHIDIIMHYLYKAKALFDKILTSVVTCSVKLDDACKTQLAMLFSISYGMHFIVWSLHTTINEHLLIQSRATQFVMSNQL